MASGKYQPSLATLCLSALSTFLILLLVLQSQVIIQRKGGSSQLPEDAAFTATSISHIFILDPTLEDISHAGDTAWRDSLLTPKGGFLWVQYNESYEESYGISMFHALHCLQLIRGNLQESPSMKAYIAEKSGSVVTDMSKSGGGTRPHHGEHSHQQHLGDPGHVAHCVSYIAQVQSRVSAEDE